MTKENNVLKVGDKVTLSVKKLGINGEGIAYYKKTIVFISGALPKEKVKATISKIHHNFVEAELTDIMISSSNRVEPSCPVYETCGGCQLQHLDYPSQLEFKKDVYIQALKKFKPTGFQNYKVKSTIGMKNPWHYRNKLQYQLQKKQDNVEMGLFAEGSHNLVNVTDCLVQDEETTEVANFVRKMIEELQIPIYDEHKNSGIIKRLMVRRSFSLGEIQLVIITNSKKLPKKRELINSITTNFPSIVSIMQNVQLTKTSIIMGDETVCLYGKETIGEELNNIVFDLSARAFFQLNTSQTDILYQEAINYLEVEPTDNVIDAYCGVGTIGLSVAPFVKEVRGMDTVSSAIEDAKTNAEQLEYNNTLYETGTAESVIPKWQSEGFVPTGLIVDPPRVGLDKSLVQYLVKNPVEKLVYISCNTSTLARDLVYLSHAYNVVESRGVDMFPQTARCEIVVKMKRK